MSYAVPSGVEGVLVRKKNLYRLVLSVDMMAKSVAVEIDATDVEPAPARSSNGISPGKQFAGTGRSGEPPPHGDRQFLVFEKSEGTQRRAV